MRLILFMLQYSCMSTSIIITGGSWRPQIHRKYFVWDKFTASNLAVFPRAQSEWFQSNAFKTVDSCVLCMIATRDSLGC